MGESCGCGSKGTVIFACSGSSDTGSISDQAARRLTIEGVGKMACLAKIGGQIPGFVDSTKAAERILAIDGCPVDCAKKSLEGAGINSFVHVRVTDLGLKKGSSPVTPESIALVADRARTLVGATCSN